MATREELLEKELRRWAVSFRVAHYHCDVCTGKWTRWEYRDGRERHTAACLLRRDGDAFAEPPPSIPF